jgi:integrase
VQRVLEDDKHEKYHSNFINSLKSKNTKKDYDRRIQGFMHYLGIPEGNYADLVEGGKDRQTIEEWIIKYLLYLAEERKVRYTTRVHYLAPLIAFYDLYPDLEIRWKNVKKYLGSDDDELTEEQIQNGEGGEQEDRPYTVEEIQDIVRNSDSRTKVIILLIASCGVRVGGIPVIKIRNLKRTKSKYGDLYQITVYEKSQKSRYVTYCTPECAETIDDYLEYRKHEGEDVYAKKGASPLIREQFNSKDSFKVNNPRHIQTPAVAWLVNQVLTKYSVLRNR